MYNKSFNSSLMLQTNHCLSYKLKINNVALDIFIFKTSALLHLHNNDLQIDSHIDIPIDIFKNVLRSIIKLNTNINSTYKEYTINTTIHITTGRYNDHSNGIEIEFNTIVSNNNVEFIYNISKENELEFKSICSNIIRDCDIISIIN